MTHIQIGRSRLRLPFVLLVLWGLFILYGTTIPFDLSASSARVAAKLQKVLEQPWQTASRMDIVSNVLLFLPWGFLCSVWLADRGTDYAVSLIVALLTGMALSGFVEFLQLFTPTAHHITHRRCDQSLWLGDGRRDRMALGAVGESAGQALVGESGQRAAHDCRFVARSRRLDDFRSRSL